MTGKDKDYRYMATSDLLNELNKEDFKADADLEIKLSNIVLQQLDDDNRYSHEQAHIMVKQAFQRNISKPMFLFVV